MTALSTSAYTPLHMSVRTSTQKEVYDYAAKPIVTSVLKGLPLGPSPEIRNNTTMQRHSLTEDVDNEPNGKPMAAGNFTQGVPVKRQNRRSWCRLLLCEIDVPSKFRA
eukprot:504150-Amphidinium_carterae.1